MYQQLFTHTSSISASVERAFEWHERPGALERLVPPWDPLQVLSASSGIEVGAKVRLLMKAGPFPVNWQALHTQYEKNKCFVDIQARGPFTKFHHHHIFHKQEETTSTLEDKIEFEMPMGWLGNLFSSKIHRQLEQIFRYRHHILRNDLWRHGRNTEKPCTILISGAGGMLGSALVPFLTTGGHNVVKLVRRTPKNENELFWDPRNAILDLSPLKKIDFVIHLAGENIGNARWSKEKKEQMLSSRIQGTALLSSTLAKREQKPRALLSASAIGFYGNRGGEELDEESTVGQDSISSICNQWEDATIDAQKAAIRVALLRIGVVLSPKDGALRKMLLPTQLGLGGPMGNGRQIVSWISINDLVWAIHHIMFDPSLYGPINVNAPHPVSNAEFVTILATKLHRASLFRVPSAVILALFGEMGREIVLSSTNVIPRKLLDSGFEFRYPNLDEALTYLLGIIPQKDI